MTIEDKAKRYDEVIEELRWLLECIHEDKCNIMEEDIIKIFPELKENEDERIRKQLIVLAKGSLAHTDEEINEMLAWLEKHAKNNMGISEATKRKLEFNLNKALEKETPESWNEFLDEQKPADKAERKGMNIVEEDMTPFQKKVFCIIDTTIEEEQGLKQVCDELLRLAYDEVKQKPAWSEEDEEMLKMVIKSCEQCGNQYAYYWLKSLKERVQPQPKQEWSENDERIRKISIGLLEVLGYQGYATRESVDWLKSLRPQTTWKPSVEHYELEEFAKIVRGNLTGISKAVQKLFEAKYLQLTGNKMYRGFKD